MTHILAIHAHPDDIETLAAGTLALLAQKGHRITIATMTAGEGGAIDTAPEETARIRKGEAAAAAKLIGAAYVCAGFGDLALFNDDASRRRTVELIRSVRPELVITAAPVDYHPDHEATSALVRDALFAAPVPNYRTGPSPVLETIPPLYFTDPIGGRDRDGRKVPFDFAVDIGSTIETKKAMLAAHASQVAWEIKQHGISNIVAAMEAWVMKRGSAAGVAYAEGFRQYTGHPWPRAQVLQDLVGDALRTA